jgi:hypothetical protein
MAHLRGFGVAPSSAVVVRTSRDSTRVAAVLDRFVESMRDGSAVEIVIPSPRHASSARGKTFPETPVRTRR